MKKHNLFKSFLSIVLLSALSFSAEAAQVNLLSVHSESMNKDVNVVCVTPDIMDAGRRCPVIYLLHGYAANQDAWLRIQPALPRMADQYGVAFVTPDAKNSWYWDSPVNNSYRYETFVSKELVEYIDAHFKTRPTRNFRAITGLSMGGHGAFWLAIRHQDTFGAVGSMSGGLDIRPFPDNWEMKNQLGDYKFNKEVWDNHTVINQLDKLTEGALAITFDCGVDDFFFQVNENVHKKLMEMKISHDFTARPGAHTNEYWNNSLDYQIVFFHKFFQRSAQNSHKRVKK